MNKTDVCTNGKPLLLRHIWDKHKYWPRFRVSCILAFYLLLCRSSHAGYLYAAYIPPNVGGLCRLSANIFFQVYTRCQFLFVQVNLNISKNLSVELFFCSYFTIPNPMVYYLFCGQAKLYFLGSPTSWTSRFWCKM